MKKKIWEKTVAGLLTISMAAGVLAGCGSSGAGDAIGDQDAAQEQSDSADAENSDADSTANEADTDAAQLEEGLIAAAEAEKTISAEDAMAYLDTIAQYKAANADAVTNYLGYTLQDLNGDGTAELLFAWINEKDADGDYIGDYCEEIYTLEDGAPKLLLEKNDYNGAYVQEDGTIYNYSFFGYSLVVYTIYALQGSKLVPQTAVTYRVSDDIEETYTQVTYDEKGDEDEEIDLTEEEADTFFENLTFTSFTLTPLMNMTEDDDLALTGELYEAFEWPENPSWSYYLADGIAPDGVAEQSVFLEKTSEAANEITDTGRWFNENGLSYSENNLSYATDVNFVDYRLKPYNAEYYTLKAQLEDDNYVYTLYGDEDDYFYCAYVINLYDKETMRYVKTFNLNSFRYPETDSSYIEEIIHWVHSEDGILYVSMGHNTYAETAPDNAYVMAFDIESGELRWKSRPLVSNAVNFAIVGDALICGYGFTAEPDYLYILDKETGAGWERISVKTGPDYIIQKGDTLYVRTYDMDYTYKITQK